MLEKGEYVYDADGNYAGFFYYSDEDIANGTPTWVETMVEGTAAYYDRGKLTEIWGSWGQLVADYDEQGRLTGFSGACQQEI